MQLPQFLRTLKLIAGWGFVFCALSLCTTTALATPSNPVPHIDSLSPLSAAPGGAQFTLTVNGTGFTASSTVVWNSTSLATTFASATQLTAIVPAPLIAGSGTGWVTVSNPAPGGGTSNLVFLPVGNSSAHVNFATFTLTSGSSPVGVAQADFNGDGKLDIVTANYGANTLSVFLGNGDGTFQTPGTVTVPSGMFGPVGLAVGDFNDDGVPDLVVGYDDATLGVSVLLGNGDGTFAAAQTFSAGSLTYEMVVGDFNEDGNLDVAVTNYNGSVVQVLLGNGDGTLQTAVPYAVNSGAFFIQEADLNSDGHIDLVVGNFNGSGVSVLLGNGDGTFQPQQTYNAGTQAADVAIGDFDGDGKLDLIATDQGSTNMNFLRGNGDGTFQAAQAVPVGFSTRVVAAADFNADGKLDLAIVRNGGGGGVGVLLGNGDGTFQNAQSFPGAAFTYGIIVGNYNTGGGLAIATTDFTTNKLDVLLQTVSISPASITFGSEAIGIASTAQNFTITNSTSQVVNFAGISFTGTNNSDFAEMDNCGSSLASGASCTVQVTFAPGAAGARSAVLSVADDAPASPQTAAVSGTGTAAPVVSLSANGLSFPNENVGVTSASQAVTVTNTGTATLNIASIAVTGTNAADFNATNTCGATLTVSAMCTITVTFTPSGAGARSAMIAITDDAADSPESMSLSGQGLLAPTATLSASSLAFSQQAVGSTSTAQAATLTNNGNSALAITSIAVGGVNTADFAVSNTCGASVAAGGHCSISVTFAPAAAGARSASITITDTAADSPQSITLSGQGLAPAATLSASSLTFAQQIVGSTSAAQAVTLTNSGNSALAVTSIAASGTNAADFSVTNNCGASLAASAQCSVSVTFTPAASGARSAAISITDSASGSPQSITLSGTGQDFSLSLASPTATVTAGNAANLQLTVTPIAGYNQVITLTCSGAPALATCTISPSSVTPSGSAISVTVTLNTAGQMINTRHDVPTVAPNGDASLRMLILVALCIFGSGLAASFSKTGEDARWGSRTMTFGGVLLAALSLAACSGTVSAPATPKTPAGSYTLTITATSGSLTRSTTVTLTVQ